MPSGQLFRRITEEKAGFLEEVVFKQRLKGNGCEVDEIEQAFPMTSRGRVLGLHRHPSIAVATLPL